MTSPTITFSATPNRIEGLPFDLWQWQVSHTDTVLKLVGVWTAFLLALLPKVNNWIDVLKIIGAFVVAIGASYASCSDLRRVARLRGDAGAALVGAQAAVCAMQPFSLFHELLTNIHYLGN